VVPVFASEGREAKWPAREEVAAGRKRTVCLSGNAALCSQVSLFAFGVPISIPTYYHLIIHLDNCYLCANDFLSYPRKLAFLPLTSYLFSLKALNHTTADDW
jgi:hypothetical protein